MTPLDPIDDALGDLRVSGTVLLHESYAPPWTILVPDETRLRALLGVGQDLRVLPFHLVRRNAFDLRLDDGPTVTVRTAEVAICPTGAAHRMSVGRGGRVTTFEAILQGDGPVPAAADPLATECVCGVFMVRATPLNPMLGALPPILKVSTGDPAISPLLAGATQLLTLDLDRGVRGGFTTARMLEVFCAETIRAYVAAADPDLSGWFKGLADPRLSPAIRQIHADPAHPWTVETLAGLVALSPSRFAARFRDTLGQSVMAYVGRWRANIACRLLRDGDRSIADIATAVGYDSLPAFSRAFKAQLGLPPATWRASTRGADAR